MRRNVVEIKKHEASAGDAARHNRGVKTITVTTLFLECGHRRIFRGTSKPIPAAWVECKDCDREMAASHFQDKRDVQQGQRGGVQ
jgi:hypothetical protein